MRFPVPRPLLAICLAAALSVLACSNTAGTSGIAPAPAYSVASGDSNVSFVTTKSGAAGTGGLFETMRFTRYEGGVDARGQIRLQIDLASVDSGIGIRDERLRTLLWNVKATPHATFTAQLPEAMLRQLGQGAQNVELEGQLQMAGQSQPVKASLRVATLAGKQLLVSTRQPIVINAQDFGLSAGVEALRESVGLHFLGSSASVNLNLTLQAL